MYCHNIVLNIYWISRCYDVQMCDVDVKPAVLWLHPCNVYGTGIYFLPETFDVAQIQEHG